LCIFARWLLVGKCVKAATTQSRSYVKRKWWTAQPKRLNVNANNRSERAEQEKYQSEIRCKKSEKLYLTLNLGEADSREWRQNCTI
jgi:hypothetical protein